MYFPSESTVWNITVDQSLHKRCNCPGAQGYPITVTSTKAQLPSVWNLHSRPSFRKSRPEFGERVNIRKHNWRAFGFLFCISRPNLFKKLWISCLLQHTESTFASFHCDWNFRVRKRDRIGSSSPGPRGGTIEMLFLKARKRAERL